MDEKKGLAEGRKMGEDLEGVGDGNRCGGGVSKGTTCSEARR